MRFAFDLPAARLNNRRSAFNSIPDDNLQNSNDLTPYYGKNFYLYSAIHSLCICRIVEKGSHVI